MKNPILAVLTVTDSTVMPKAQVVLRKDGALDAFGDPSAAVEAVALFLHVGARMKVEERPITEHPDYAQIAEKYGFAPTKPE